MPTRTARGVRTLICGTAFVILASSPSFALNADDQAPASPIAPATTGVAAPSRPAALVPLYVSFAGLNALDIDSTYRALAGNAEEANPMAARLVHSPAALIAVKAGTTAAAIIVTERLRRSRPKTAILLMIGLNSAMAAIVAHNYAIAAGPRR
jgi:hypothetical protein